MFLEIKCYTSNHQTESDPTPRDILRSSLLIFAFGFPVDHLPKARQDLALPLPPLLLVEGGQSSLFIRAVDLVFLPQTHSLHTTVSAGRDL